MTISEHALLAGVLVYSTQWLEQLSPEQKSLLMDAGRKLVKRQRELALAIEQENLKTIQRSGTSVIRLTPEEKNVLKEASKTVEAQYRKAYGDDLLDQIYAKAKE